MILLLLTSLVWAFSFGLIGNRLAGLDPAVVAVVRLSLSLLFFAPCACRAGIGMATAVRLLLLGGVEFGLMYVFYTSAFTCLPSHLVALFTVTTPFYVALLANLGAPRRAARPLLAAGLAVAGAAIVRRQTLDATHLWTGFALVQASNLCFAAGQLGYRRLMLHTGELRNAPAMAWMYAGGVMAALPFAVIGWRAHGFAPDWPQLAVLGYLGIVASGICFWLWNSGARRAHSATLAVMNNAKIPLGVAASLLVFREPTDLRRLVAAAVLMAVAVALCELPFATLRPNR
ncbi:MAG: EamA family transporter [Kiritimatiellae bacterium]|nr:EamA family transporter [Kiritimatiellia bacterium]